MYTWKFEGKKIVADTDTAFEVIRKQYFPGIPASKWVRSLTNSEERN